jgi:hypothetical protein
MMCLWSDTDVFGTKRLTNRTDENDNVLSGAIVTDGENSAPTDATVEPFKQRGPREERFRLLMHGTVDCTFTSWSITVKREKSDDSDEDNPI